MDRLEYIRVKVDRILQRIPSAEEQKFAYIHLYGVSKWAAYLAMKENLSPEIAAVSGMLHDIARYQMNSHDHAAKGAELAKEILNNTQLFTADEIKIIIDAIAHHSDKEHIHDVYDELLKNSDVLDHYFYNTKEPISSADQKRLMNLLRDIQ